MRVKLIVTAVIICLLSLSAIQVDAQTKRRRRATKRTTTAKTETPKSSIASVTTPSGLTYLTTRTGTGRQPKAGETVIVHYTGTLTNGVKFDSSRDREEPFAFKLGAGQVIKGWDETLARMHIGENVIVVIPSELAYGARGAGDVIPPNSTLVFIIELLDVKSKSITDIMTKTLQEKGVAAMIAEFRALKDSGDPELYISESALNFLGYSLLRKQQVNEAIEVLKLNVEAYPQSSNVYDSLGEAYLRSGDKEKAIENYEKALKLDPASDNAKQMLKRLRGQ